MAVAPRAALAMAMNATGESLQERYENAPSSILFQSAEYLKDGNLAVNTDVNYAGEQLRAQLQFGFNDEKKQSTVGAALTVREQSYSANVYLDPEFAAVSADFFNEGTYYGVAFETFREDIRQSVFSEMLSDGQVESIDQFLRVFLDVYTLDVDKETLAEPYRKIITQYMKDLSVEKGRDPISLDGKQYNCSTLTYHLTEENVRDLLQDVLCTMRDDAELKKVICMDSVGELTGNDLESEFVDGINETIDSLSDAFASVELSVDVVFYVRSGRLMALNLDTDIKEDGKQADLKVDVSFGLNATSDIITCITASSEGQTAQMQFVSKVTDKNDIFKESFFAEIRLPDEDAILVTCSTKWERASGKLTVSADVEANGEQKQLSVSCNLKKLENGYELTFNQDDAADFLNQLNADTIPDDLDFSVTIRCTECANISKPEYVNIRQWDAALLQQLQETLTELFA